MNYEKKYEDALERASKLRVQNPFDTVSQMMEHVFPELCESEDEKIRKALIRFHKSTVDIDGIRGDDIVSWLEKQGHQEEPQVYETEDGEIITYSESEGYKVIEPKFHKGQWITNGDYTWKIVKVKPLDYILQSQEGNIVDDTISHVDEQFHSFTIKDAKDGDVLYSPCLSLLWIFKSIDTVYCGCNLNYNDGAFCGEGYIERPTDAIPSTKKQRDTLMKAIADAGYTFDFEKKELKLLITNGGDF